VVAAVPPNDDIRRDNIDTGAAGVPVPLPLLLLPLPLLLLAVFVSGDGIQKPNLVHADATIIYYIIPHTTCILSLFRIAVTMISMIDVP
jgi:hypothetical protein